MNNPIDHFREHGAELTGDARRSRKPKEDPYALLREIEELEQALEGHPDIVMLDNFDLETLRLAVARTRAAGSTRLEASGNVSLETVRAIAETGVDYVSVGELTKNLRAVDLSMRFRLDP